MPKSRIGRRRGEEITRFLEIGKAKKGVRQSAVAKYLCMSEKTLSFRKADGERSLVDFALLCRYFNATDEEILSMVKSYFSLFTGTIVRRKPGKVGA